MTQPTGVAGININGNTKHSALYMPCRSKLLPLNDTNEAEPRNKYSEVELVTIDEISMASSTLFYQVHKRMIEIFYLGQDFLFAGKSGVFFVEICITYHQSVPNLYLLSMKLKQQKNLYVVIYGKRSD